MRKVVAGLAVAALAVGLTACEPDSPRLADDNTPASVSLMPDDYGNVATKCIPGTSMRIAVPHYGQAVALALDPTCAQIGDSRG